jgi:hypothetical protein
MNQITRMTGGGPPVGAQQDGWVWNGWCWVCDPDCPPPFPPPPVMCPPCPPPVPMFPPAIAPPATQPAWYPGANGGVTFAATAPPNPTRGHFWFDGITLWLFDGAAWVGVKMENVGGGNGSVPPVTVPSGPTPPFAPMAGALWFNGSVLYVWNGSAWVPTSQTKTWMQSTQPASPLPGDTWFDGTQFHIFDGTTWVLIGPTAAPVTPPVVPTTTEKFAMTQGSALAVGTGWNVLPYSASPLIDPDSGWDGSSHKFTAKKTGVYFFSLRVLTANAAAIAVVKDDPGTFTGINSSDIVVATNSNPVAGQAWVVCAGMVPMTANTDYVRAWTNHGGTVPAAGSNPIFTGFLLP